MLIDGAPMRSYPGKCAGCKMQITDRFYLLAAGNQWHDSCLRCCECNTVLDSQVTCFLRDNQIYCREDYHRIFSDRRCAKCSLIISHSELVMRAREAVFHMGCFRCNSCEAFLQKGDIFGLKDGQVYCKGHYENLILDEYLKYKEYKCTMSESASPDSDEPKITKSHRTKRMRTSFKHHQLRIMKSYFSVNQNPDAKDLRLLAEKTDLTKRVLQVWFQNARAKWRRNLMRLETNSTRELDASLPLIDTMEYTTYEYNSTD